MKDSDQKLEEASLRYLTKRPWNTPKVLESEAISTEKLTSGNEGFAYGVSYGPS